MLLRIDCHHQLEIVPADGTVRLGQYVLDTSNHYGSRLPWASLEYDRATVSLVADPGEAARAILFSAPPASGSRLWLEPWVLSPVAEEPLEVGRRLLHAYVVRRRGSDEDFLRHEHATNRRIAEWEATHGWHYVGVFHVHGLEPRMRADLYVVDADDAEEAMRKAAVDEPSDVGRIQRDAVEFLDRGERRYQLWLTPVTGQAGRPVRFADTDPATPG